VIDLTGAPGRN